MSVCPISRATSSDAKSRTTPIVLRTYAEVTGSYDTIRSETILKKYEQWG